MEKTFEIVDEIYLIQSGYQLDLHNDFDFTDLNYSVEKQSLTLIWIRSRGDWVSAEVPKSLKIVFSNVSEFRFLPRNSKIPFSEDDCLNSFGYWADEDWADGVIIIEKGQNPDPHWLTALDFMSGAVVVVQTKSAHSIIKS